MQFLNLALKKWSMDLDVFLVMVVGLVIEILHKYPLSVTSISSLKQVY